MIRLLASDVDGTLIHRFPGSPRQDTEDLFHVETGRDNFVGVAARVQLERLKEHGIPIVLITSRRMSTFAPVSRHLPHTFAVVEDGCVVLDTAGAPDQDWLEKIAASLGATVDADGRIVGGRLGAVIDNLENCSVAHRRELVVETHGFLVSFKVTLSPKELPKAVSDPRAYVAGLAHGFPDALRVSLNTQDRSLLVIPVIAGKKLAMDYVLARLRLDWSEVCALGNDLNDLEMLSEAGYPMTLRGAQADVETLVRSRKGYVADAAGPLGTSEMLERVFQAVEG